MKGDMLNLLMYKVKSVTRLGQYGNEPMSVIYNNTLLQVFVESSVLKCQNGKINEKVDKGTA